MGDVFFRELDLPMAVRATTIPDSNGDFTIIVNINLSSEAKKAAIMHEMCHIKHDHFYREFTVEADEEEARTEERSQKARAYLKGIRIT